MSFHNYRGAPSTRRIQDQGANWSQARTRHGQGSYDQHGRQWSYSADNRNGMPASIIAPAFDAPWTPDQQYLRINPDDTSELYIDYVAMYRDRKNALAGFHKEAVRWARRNKQPIPKMGQYTDDIVEVVGQPPRALELIAAAAMNNPWVLGLTSVEDPRLVQFLETTSPDLEAELEEFDYGADSYEKAIRGEAAPARTKRPQLKQVKTVSSLEELDRAAAELAENEKVLGEFYDLGDAEDDDEGGAELVDDVEDGPESIPTDDEGAEARGDDLDELLDLEEEHDAEARGGQRVNPRKQDIATRQAARRPGSTSKNRKHGGQRSAGTTAAPEKPKASHTTKAWDPDAAKGKSLADGAAPFTG